MRKLPDNPVQKLMKEALRGVAPRKHDKHINDCLVLDFQNGDEDAGWQLAQEYVDVFSVIMNKPTKPPHKSKAMQKLWVDPNLQDYEDLFQEILTHFMVLLHEYHPDKGSLVRFIRATLHQRVFNQFFSEFIAIKNNEMEFDDDIKLSYMYNEEDEDEKVPSHYLELYQALNKLTRRQRQIVELSVFKEWSSVVIAHETGISAITARVTLKNALQVLRKELGGEENEQ